MHERIHSISLQNRKPGAFISVERKYQTQNTVRSDGCRVSSSVTSVGRSQFQLKSCGVPWNWDFLILKSISSHTYKTGGLWVIIPHMITSFLSTNRVCADRYRRGSHRVSSRQWGFLMIPSLTFGEDDMKIPLK